MKLYIHTSVQYINQHLGQLKVGFLEAGLAIQEILLGRAVAAAYPMVVKQGLMLGV